MENDEVEETRNLAQDVHSVELEIQRIERFVRQLNAQTAVLKHLASNNLSHKSALHTYNAIVRRFRKSMSVSKLEL